jgi:Holliday junction resolvase RusA-like endonuclease
VISMRVPGDPVAQPRPRVAVRGRHATAYVPARHPVHAWRAAVRERAVWEMAVRGLPVAKKEFPLSVELVFEIRKPKSNRTRIPVGKPDLDNLAKAVLDACEGVIWANDSQIWQLSIWKRWGSNPGVFIHAAQSEDVE